MTIRKAIFSLTLIIILVQTVFAVKSLAVLEIISAEDLFDKGISLYESRHLTDELRKQAVIALPRKEYTVLTRDNLISLMPSDEEAARCLLESCVIEMGRQIGVEYISQGTIGKFGKKLTLSIELYETMGGKLIGSIVVESEEADGLLAALRSEANPLFSKIIADSSQLQPKPLPIPLPLPQPAVSEPLPQPAVSEPLPQPAVSEPLPQPAVSEPLPQPAVSEPLPQPAVSEPLPQPAVSEPEKVPLEMPIKALETPPSEPLKPGINWKAWAMDVLGVGILTYGFLQNMEAADVHKDYSKKTDDFDKHWQKVEDAKNRRNVSYVAGSIILATGIAFHIWF